MEVLDSKPMTWAKALSEKVGRKQIITITGMLILWQAKAPSWQIALVCIAGVVSQFLIDFPVITLFRKENK